MQTVVVLVILAILGCGYLVVTNFSASVAALVGVLALTGLWYIFWPAVIGLFVILTLMVDDRRDHWFGLPLSMLALFMVFQFSNKFNLVGFAKQETPMFFLYVAGYLAIGIVWSIIRVRLLARDINARHKRQKQKFMAKPGRTEKEWLETLKRYDRPNFDSSKKSQVMAWLAYWPFSVVWFAFHDLFRRLLDSIYKTLRHAYRITFESALTDTLSDYNKAEEMAGGQSGNQSDDDDDDDDDDRDWRR